MPHPRRLGGLDGSLEGISPADASSQVSNDDEFNALMHEFDLHSVGFSMQAIE